MRYKINATCPMCGRRYSYWSDADIADRLCPFADDADHVFDDGPRANGICNDCADIPFEQW